MKFGAQCISFSTRRCVSAVRLYCTPAPAGGQEVRVRFAPSPTGNLHLGSLRTLLCNYVFAKRNNGKFIIRIEDTDTKRTVPGAVERMNDIIRWVELIPDEGPGYGGDFGPYFQSERLAHYRQFAKQLVEADLAYPCFCSAEDLARRREAFGPGYDGACRHLTMEERSEKLSGSAPHVIRIKMPEKFSAEFTDMVQGSVEFSLTERDDQVLLKADGFPTYHLANVVDDHLMKISHVIRGAEWLSSTALHFRLYEALGWAAPQFAHLPLIFRSDGSKLSKRHADSFVSHYREEGYRVGPLLGLISGVKCYEFQSDKMLFTMEEIIKECDFEEVTSVRTALQGLKRLQANHICNILPVPCVERDRLLEDFRLALKDVLAGRSLEDIPDHRWSDEYLIETLKELSLRYEFLKKMAEVGYYFLMEPVLIEEQRNNKVFQRLSATTWQGICDSLHAVEDWTTPNIMECLKVVQKETGIPNKSLMTALRICIMGAESGCGIAPVSYLIGKSSTLSRLHRYEKQLKFAS